MKSTNPLKLLLIGGLLATGAVTAGEAMPESPVTEDGVVSITWQNPKDYTDIRSANMKKSRYERQLFETLTHNLNKEASKLLKPGQQLRMTVTNLDLAGDMRPTFGATPNDIRVVKPVYPPRMSFSYQILEGEQVIMAGDEKLTDLGFMDSMPHISNKPYMYETKMLNDWLDKTLKPGS
ncbi:DUF3016 domain-containing protein [Shewanella sp. AS16]|uniref:DUF3016 domain-containing protein n=1 Tax=Shewanella sp. AS16 TaxID=2907625 RepID=UPI001F1F7E99|nr:DUF3016 domain-containing protein [Shewanella sp. AS16]MCE9685863.1 DUF3016 domain-containing protein [Shewanella sp. AS16]